MNTRIEPRRSNGKRLQGDGLTAMVARDIIGMVLAQAFTTLRAFGIATCVGSIDGMELHPHARADVPTVVVNVRDGIVVHAVLRAQRTGGGLSKRRKRGRV